MAVEQATRPKAKHWINVNVRIPQPDGSYKIAQLGGVPIYDEGLDLIPVSANLAETNPTHYDLAMNSNPLRRNTTKIAQAMTPGDTKLIQMPGKTDKDEPITLLAELEIRAVDPKNQNSTEGEAEIPLM